MLQITKEKVLEAASKCSTAEATLKVLFPEVFEGDFKEAGSIEVDVNYDTNPYKIYIGLGNAPFGLQHKCLMISKDDCIITTYHGDFVIVPKILEHLINPAMKKLS